MNTYTKDKIIGTMSPITLASFIADVHALGTGADFEQMFLASEAEKALSAIVGDDYAQEMISQAMDKLIDSQCEFCGDPATTTEGDTPVCQECHAERP